MTTPAQEIRAAAEKIRKTPAYNNDGQWGVETVTGDSLGVYSYSRHEFVATVGSVSGDPACERDAAWMALMSPALAGPLEEMLNSAAAAVESGAPCPPPLLHFVRVINGSTP
jgi:hypothetical protein